MPRTKPERDPGVEPGCLVPVIEWILKFVSRGSPYHWITWWMRRTGKWPGEELVPFWFAEVYILLTFLVLALGFCFVPIGSGPWFLFVIVAVYRLIDLAQALASIVVFSSRERRDDQGGYILARDPIRWVLLTLVHFAEIILYFSYAYLTCASEFEPKIETRIAAIYQSLATFVVGGGSAPKSDLGRVVVMLQLSYFVLFVIVVAPVVLSLIRAKERTTEVFGEDHERDP